MPEAASGLWRSEDMVMLQLHMQREVAHDSVFKLGQLGMFQFLDLNKTVSAFQRDFAQDAMTWNGSFGSWPMRSPRWA